MPCKKQTDKYRFSTNSNYYNLSTSMTFSNNIRAEDICQEFKFLHKSLRENPMGGTTVNEKFSDYDCDFLNFWLNDKLRKSVNNGLIQIKEFYKEIKNKDETFFSKTNDLEEYLYVIDSNVLENMKLLYNLYDNAVKIISIINTQNYIDAKEKNKDQESCSVYKKEFDENYKKAMDRCFNSNDNFYSALKNFKDGYKIITEPSSNESNACNPREFSFFPEYDPIPEKEKRIMTIKISSTLSFTPFGPFLRAKINMVKDRWMNPDKNGDELLPLSTDIEDIISDNENYNIGYYSETNY
ncbi:PIR Superfamily Protein [Plasmodium ovale wallikeri]|uniref:PIR Superfamily Protein n=1 Tax=Plasmodium ovale wallikeri TaxID=864142 RepID=A0A1A9AME1_PLAOA|nr:PIR Superfamily Protein [Plasmodium ovale wallikeri]